MAKQPKHPKKVQTLRHDGAKRVNNPTAELEGLVLDDEANPVRVDYPRKNNPDDTPELYERNEDLDPQLVWLGKDEEDREALSIDALPIYIQEHIHPKAIVEDIRRQAQKDKVDTGEETADLFADWAGELDPEDAIKFYTHERSWTNRMILGDSLSVMTSLAEKEGLKGQVQCIYMDPPYGIKFKSNWQTSTKSRTVGENDISREPEAIKAFRDTWENGINSYLSYLRDRLVVAHDLLSPSGSLFLQISDENVHLVRSLMDEIFGKENFVSQISFKKSSALGTKGLASISDYLIWYTKNKDAMKYFPLFESKGFGRGSMYTSVMTPDGKDRPMTKDEKDNPQTIPSGYRLFRNGDLTKPGPGSKFEVQFNGKKYIPGKRWWGITPEGMQRAIKASRLIESGKIPGYKRYFNDFTVQNLDNNWVDSGGAANPVYVVQTNTSIVQRCILMTTAPGDLVLDPTCGSGTTAVVAEQWGRRWITTDTSRVSITLARARLMGTHFDYYLLNDSQEGARKELEISGTDITKEAYSHNIQNGLVYERVPHITLGGIANNAKIDSIWEDWQEVLEPLRAALNTATKSTFEEWNIPRDAEKGWSNSAVDSHAKWWDARINRQTEIDKSIAENAAIEYLYDKPYKQSGVVRVTGPFTVESLSPHRIVPSDAEDEALLSVLADTDDDEISKSLTRHSRPTSIEDGETKFHDVVFENLRKAGVQNTKKDERLEFTMLEPWPMGRYVQFEGHYLENGKEKKAAICIGPEYGTVTRSLLVQAAREAADYFDVLIVMGFAFEAYADNDLVNIGRMRVLRARMNNDLHMADRLKTGKSGNLFVVFGEPDIDLRTRDDGMLEVEILGIDIFDPTSGEVKSSSPDEIACWFIDTEYNESAFFVRHAYFSGGGSDPYKKLKRTLKADIDITAWDTLYTTTSRPFPKPLSGRIAVKAINHYGDEVLRVFDVK